MLYKPHVYIFFFSSLNFVYFGGSSKFRVISNTLVILFSPFSSESSKTQRSAMATLARPSLLFVSSINPTKTFSPCISIKPNSLSFSFSHRPRPLRFSQIRSSRPSESDSEPEGASSVTDEWGEKPGTENKTESQPDNAPVITDEWGEKSGPETEESGTRFADSDPPRNEDEWEERNGGEAEVDAGNGSAVVDDRTWELKRCLADTVYGTELGFRAGSEVRAEVLELVNQLEALNPTPAPVENPELLDGNWVLL